MRADQILKRCTVLCLVATVPLPVYGCFSPFYRSVDVTRLRAVGDYEIVAGLEVPAARGPDGCGAQALAAVLAYHDPVLDPAAVADALPWHTDGATPVDLLLAARERGFDARISRGSWDAIAEQVRLGRPPLVMVDAAPEVRTLFHLSTPKSMHWSVVSGVESDGTHLVLGARGDRFHVVERDDFLKRWSRSANCLILVTKPRPPS
ncbi:MAG: cysteine peptidase family C39 domain-containing protein [Planctomycetota bacterium]|jgi:ABC-type bacteriocin/lantibiotic exporter with double-glycine peptidase domain